MSNITKLIFIIFAFVACQQVEPMREPEMDQQASGAEFTAQIEGFGTHEHGLQTKTTLADKYSVTWSSGDQLAVFQGASDADKYQVNEGNVGSANGTFSIAAASNGASTSNFDTNIALYPYEDGLTCSPITENGEITSYQITGTTIPSTQTYAAQSFPNGSFLMAAITDGLNDHILDFKNICGAIKLQLKGTAKIKRIELRGNNKEPLSCDAIVTVYPDGSTPSLRMSNDASTSVTLNCGDGVQLNENTATEFLIAIPPTAFKKGFTATIEAIDGKIAVLQTEKTNEVMRSYVHTMSELAIIAEWPEVDEGILTGISIACIGDSITQGVGADGHPYPKQLATRLNADVMNLGVSGTSLCEGGSRTCNFDKLTETNCGGKDVVTILMGVNDWAAARNNTNQGVFYHLGDINSTETNCIYGAMRMWCEKIRELRLTESCANTKFYFMTPLITSWNSSVTSVRDWDQSKKNVHGYTLRDLCKAIIDVATLYDIPVIDLNLCSGIYYNSVDDENVTLYGGDGVHINQAGHTLVTDAIIRALAGDVKEQAAKVDLFVFAGQSNMMGAVHLPPIDNTITYDSFEYKYQNVLKGGRKRRVRLCSEPDRLISEYNVLIILTLHLIRLLPTNALCGCKVKAIRISMQNTN